MAEKRNSGHFLYAERLLDSQRRREEEAEALREPSSGVADTVLTC